MILRETLYSKNQGGIGMRYELIEYINEYSTSVDKKINKGDEQRNAYNPVIFLFIGDRVFDSIHVIQEDIDERWNNSNGVLYFHIYSDKTMEESKNLYNFAVPINCSNAKCYRESIYKNFYNDESLLIDLNKKIRDIRDRILECGKAYSYFEKINISVIHRVDDPMNVILPEITAIIKSKFSEDFKIVSCDLYSLYAEKDNDHDFGYSLASSMAFFRETEYFQDNNYCFVSPIEVLDHGVRIDVSNNGPLFDIVYLLGDKNEEGIIHEDALNRNYQIISFVSFLKNRNSSFYEWNNESYNNSQFINNIDSSSKRVSYATAGLAKIKRPNNAIAASVLYNFFEIIISRLKENAKIDTEDMISNFNFDSYSIDNITEKFFPNKFSIDGMFALISSNVSLEEINGLTMKETEKVLYGYSCEKFFNDNFEEQYLKNIERKYVEGIIKGDIENKIINDDGLGIYYAYEFTSENGAIKYLRQMELDIEKDIDCLKEELDGIYGETIGFSPMQKLPFYKSKTLRDLKRKLIESIYTNKINMVKLKVKVEIIKIMEDAFLDSNNNISQKIREIENLKDTIKSFAKDNLDDTDEYLGQNINEYYGFVVETALKDMENRGIKIYSDDRFLGNVSLGLYKDADKFLDRMIHVCKKDILSTPYFFEDFEDELLHRANVVSGYEDKGILTKDELFLNLYNRLEKDASLSVYLIDFTVKHRYDEKYFFGDYYSEFIKYAFKVDEKNRTYKLGCVHEKRTSGMEKLNLMGGFTIEDLVYGKKCYKYYAMYLKEGFKLHGIDMNCLPKIEYGVKL